MFGDRAKDCLGVRIDWPVLIDLTMAHVFLQKNKDDILHKIYE